MSTTTIFEERANKTLKKIKNQFKKLVVHTSIDVSTDTFRAAYAIEKGRLFAKSTITWCQYTKQNDFGMAMRRVRHVEMASASYNSHDKRSIGRLMDRFDKSVDDVIRFFNVDECVAKPRKFIEGYVVDGCGDVILRNGINRCFKVDTVGLVGNRIVAASDKDAEPWFKIEVNNNKRSDTYATDDMCVLFKKSGSDYVYIRAEGGMTYDARTEGDGDERLTTVDAQLLDKAVNQFLKRGRA